MMVEDLGVEAKESFVCKVAKLMCLLELLQSINSIKTDYITHQQVKKPKNKLGGSKTTWKTETGSVRVERIGSSRRLTHVEVA
ncbi:hypothetical protein IC575_006491 [Cucumis melo]